MKWKHWTVISGAPALPLLPRFACTLLIPVLLYGAETWTMTKVVSKKIDSFDLWSQRRILRVHYGHHVSNCEIRNRVGCTPATIATLRPHYKVWTWNGSPSCSTCRNSRTACWLETTARATKTDMDSNCWKRSETCTPRGSEHKIELTGGTLWRQQRSTRSMLLMMMMMMIC